jgi:hypothetical protein
MAEEPRNDGDVTPKGAVEVNEEDLDQATGGLSLNYSKIEMTYKPKPTTSADPDGGGEVDIQKSTI